MQTEQDRITKLEDDMVDMKIKVGIHDSDITTLKAALGDINRNLNKVFWTVVGSSVSLAVGIILALVAWFLNKH